MKLKIVGCGNVYSKSNSASYLIDDKILIDVPNGSFKVLKNMEIEPSKLKHILITHFHGDHFFDLIFLLTEKIFKNTDVVDIYCDHTAENKVYELTKLDNLKKIAHINKYFNYIHDNQFDIDEYTIEKISVEHEKGIEAYGYIFRFDNKCIGFTGDSGPCENVLKMASICNHLICDCNSIEGKEYFHMGIDNIKELACKYPNCTFYTTHMDDTTKEELNRLNINNVVILNDYDEFIL